MVSCSHLEICPTELNIYSGQWEAIALPLATAVQIWGIYIWHKAIIPSSFHPTKHL